MKGIGVGACAAVATALTEQTTVNIADHRRAKYQMLSVETFVDAMELINSCDLFKSTAYPFKHHALSINYQTVKGEFFKG